MNIRFHALAIYLALAAFVLSIPSVSRAAAPPLEQADTARPAFAGAGPANRPPKTVKVSDAVLKKRIGQLQHEEHLLELQAGTDRASHSALAARDVQMAIYELGIQLKTQEKVKSKGQSKTSP